MKAAGCIEDTRPFGVSARKFDYSFNALAARTAKERLRQSSTREHAETLSQFPGQFRNVTLQHRRTVSVQFPLERSCDARMVVPDVMNTVAGIENRESAGRRW